MIQMKLILVLLITNFELVIYTTSNQIIEIEHDKLKNKYPDLTRYLLNQTNNTTTIIPKTQKIQKTTWLNNENDLFSNSKKAFKAPFYSTTTTSFKLNEKLKTSTLSINNNQNNHFLYFNNKTNKFEGVSLQSTYSIIKLNLTGHKNLSLITSTSQILPNSETFQTIKKTTSNQLPLYHQFIYTIKLNDSNKNLIDYLNSQTLESSQLRVNLIKQISSQLDLNYTNIKLNWIERLDREKKLDYLSIDDDNREHDENLILDELILISFSNLNLLNLQNTYMNINQHIINNDVLLLNKNKFKIECENFFNNLKLKHENLSNKFRINLFNENINKTVKVKKLQLIKLCNLSSIIEISSQSDQFETSKNLIKTSTEEFLFNRIKLNDYDILKPSFSEENYDYTIDYNLISNQNKKLIKFKEPINLNQSNITLIANSIDFEQTEQTKMKKYDEIFLLIKTWFWKIVPEEDFLLAVVVPITTIISLLVLTIVVACLLHMCNNNYKDSKHLSSINNTAESTISQNTEKHMSTNKANTIYRQKAYLSKGVPVILYEEMSDKPIEDYDENDVENLSGGMNSSYYRSPLIMRNEKPPIPAPPEYTRQPYFTPKSNESILNELQSMLQQSANIISLTESPSDFSPEKSPLSISSPNMIDLDDNAHLLHESSSTKPLNNQKIDTINDLNFNLKHSKI